MSEVLLVAGGLLALTAGAAIEYYRRLQKVQREYERARQAIGDVVSSFNRQLKRDEEKSELTAYKVEAVSARSDKALKTTEEAADSVKSLENKLNEVWARSQSTSELVDEAQKRLNVALASQETLSSRVSIIEEQTRQLSLIPDVNVEAVIPIRRDKALAPLTETELSVLEMLALEGPKTAPEIRERIGLSREHTARLMKKLYEGGYLERDMHKTPFKYSVKKEMENLLKKKESSTETKTS